MEDGAPKGKAELKAETCVEWTVHTHTKGDAAEDCVRSLSYYCLVGIWKWAIGSAENSKETTKLNLCIFCCQF